MWGGWLEKWAFKSGGFSVEVKGAVPHTSTFMHVFFFLLFLNIEKLFPYNIAKIFRDQKLFKIEVNLQYHNPTRPNSTWSLTMVMWINLRLNVNKQSQLKEIWVGRRENPFFVNYKLKGSNYVMASIVCPFVSNSMSGTVAQRSRWRIQCRPVE